MAQKSIFQRFFRECETSDHHFDEQLKSHYYKASFDKVYQAVFNMFKRNPQIEIVSESKERGEIGLYMNNHLKPFIVATVIQVRPFETAVDFKVSTEKFSLFGLYPKLRKLIIEFYRELDKEFPQVQKRAN